MMGQQYAKGQDSHKDMSARVEQQGYLIVVAQYQHQQTQQYHALAGMIVLNVQLKEDDKNEKNKLYY